MYIVKVKAGIKVHILINRVGVIGVMCTGYYN